MGKKKRPTGWAEIPNVAMLEIYKYLTTRTDKLNAASACKNWRVPAFQVPLSNTLYLDMSNGIEGVEKVVFLSEQFICKVKHVNIVFDVSETGLNMLEYALSLLENNYQIKSLMMSCSYGCVKYIEAGDKIRRQFLIQKVLDPLVKIIEQPNNSLESFSFPMINDDVALLSGTRLLKALEQGRSRYSITRLSFPRVKQPECRTAPDISMLQQLNQIGISLCSNLSSFTVGYEYITDAVLGTLGTGSVVGGIKQFNLTASEPTVNVSNSGWKNFVFNNPQCKVYVAVIGGSGIVAHSSSLIFPSTPLSHFSSHHSKDIRVNFVSSVIEWNLDTLEHLEIVDNNCDWNALFTHTQLNPEENIFLDPIVYAAWRCTKLQTIKLGVHYCGDTLVGIARLKGSSLVNFEIPYNLVVHNSLTLRKLSKEVSSALGRRWKPLSKNFAQKQGLLTPFDNDVLQKYIENQTDSLFSSNISASLLH